MRKIELTQGKWALVDDADYDYLSQFKWHAVLCSLPGHVVKWYARRKKRIDGGQQCLYMHREIKATPPRMVEDHEDGDGLNNQRHNLRTVTQAENTAHCRYRRKQPPECAL